MLTARNFAFRLSGLWLIYLNRIINDLPVKDRLSPTAIMKHIISDYIVLRYGADEQKNMRREYIESTLL